MPGGRGMLAKALIAAFLGVLIGGALVLSGSVRESAPAPPPIELRGLDGGRERNQKPPSREPQREPERPTAPAPVAPPSPLPGEGDDDQRGDDEEGDEDEGDDETGDDDD